MRANSTTPTLGESESAQSELCNFAVSMLEECGGLVDWPAPSDPGAAILPGTVAKLLGVEEAVSLTPRQEPGRSA